MPVAPPGETLSDPAVHTISQIASAFGGWLWVVHDESYDAYVENRLACSNSLVNSAEEADLCYPTCAGGQSLAAESVQMASVNFRGKLGWMPKVCFEVPPQAQQWWSNCATVCLQPEAEEQCSVEVPYLHGVMWPRQTQGDAPWTFNFERTSLLTFVGCDFRGNWFDRAAVIRAMQEEASRIDAASPETLFLPYLIQEPGGAEDRSHMNDWYSYGRTSDFYLQAWGHYALAKFSWQPHGDTPSRRALYDSSMFGCVPVIDTRAAHYYRNLFKGTLWKDLSLESVFVVIPEGQEGDGQAILQMLVSMPADEVEERRKRLQSIASKLQWGAHDGDDALMMALQSFR